MNYRDVLGVSATASTSEIQAAFRKAALENHPDISASPEAAEAFMRIKEARDALMREASEHSTHEYDAQAVQQATDAAVRASTNAAYAQPQAQVAVDDMFEGMSDEEIAYIQELDHLARRKPKRGLFTRRVTESAEVKRHRKKLRTMDNRIAGKY